MVTVSDTKELAIALKNKNFPIKINNEKLKDNILAIREPSRVVWIGVIASIAGMSLFLSPALIVGGFVSLPLVLATGGVAGSVALTVLGGSALVDALNIVYHGGKDVKLLNLIRAREVLEKEKTLTIY